LHLQAKISNLDHFMMGSIILTLV